MITTIRVELNDVQKQLTSVFDDLGDRVCLMAVGAGGALIEAEYAKELGAIAKRSGTYKSAQGAIEHFIQAYKSVGHRNLKFKGGGGAYSVVGIKAAEGNWRSASPQALWREEGADGHTQNPSGSPRRHKDGTSTGIEPAFHTLANIAERMAPQVLTTMQDIIAAELAKG